MLQVANNRHDVYGWYKGSRIQARRAISCYKCGVMGHIDVDTSMSIILDLDYIEGHWLGWAFDKTGWLCYQCKTPESFHDVIYFDRIDKIHHLTYAINNPNSWAARLYRMRGEI